MVTCRYLRCVVTASCTQFHSEPVLVEFLKHHWPWTFGHFVLYKILLFSENSVLGKNSAKTSARRIPNSSKGTICLFITWFFLQIQCNPPHWIFWLTWPDHILILPWQFIVIFIVTYMHVSIAWKTLKLQHLPSDRISFSTMCAITVAVHIWNFTTSVGIWDKLQNISSPLNEFLRHH